MREADVHIPDSALETEGLGEVVALAREAGLRDLSEVVCRGPDCLLSVTVENRLDESAVREVAAVSWLDRIEATKHSVVYLLSVEPPAEPAVTNREIAVDERGLALSLVGSQSAIAAAFEGFEQGASLERLGEYDGPTDPLDGLTQRQRTVLQRAHELGYFEVPRAATAEDVADSLGIDPSTATEHLQRAERNLFDRLL